ncbi:Yip1 family protein [Streptomyces sp. NPDC000348]|uniref:Yip1 family protein n=1 Tax=Streptomyces sp. NPDC000348 TaxID=3364538 RepID=UPI00369E9C9D
MSIRPWVIVEAPDRRGLRRVVVGGRTVGSAWSLTQLRDMLGRHGYPKDMDLEDPASVCWRGGDSGEWPDRAGRRRTVLVLMAAGMFTSMVLNTVIGWPDATGALTFAQRMSGALIVLSGVVQCAALIAVFDYWLRRQYKISGAVVLVGVFIAFATDGILLLMWFDEKEYTPYLLVFMPLLGWSLWALWLLIREKAWQGTPRPRTFATGVVATTVLTGVSLAYSTMYQPAAAPTHFVLKAEFGAPQADHRHPFVHVPLKFYMKNDGGIPVYIINDNFTVYGRIAEYSGGDDRLKEWKKSLDEKHEEDAERYVNRMRFTKVSSGQFYRPGYSLDVGQEYTMERVFQIPVNSAFDTINVDLQITYMRKDRGKIDVNQFRRAHRSWDKGEGRYYCSPEKCGEELYYHGRVRHNNNLVNVTRGPRYVTAVWSPGETPMYSISSFHFAGGVSRAEERREVERYNVSTAYADMAVPVAQLLKAAGG